MAAWRPIEITEPILLAVEGKDELNFFEGLIEHIGLQHIQVWQYEGKTNLRGKLKTLVMSSGFAKVTSLGVTRDADDNYSTAFASVRGALENAGLSAPARALVSTGSHPKVVVMVFPRENMNGMLEDICLDAVSSEPAMTCVTEYFDCLRREEIRIPHNRLSKARVHAFIASRQEPDLRLGLAAKRGYWPFDHDAFEQLKTLLTLIST